MGKKSMKLNLGCGDDIRPEYINIDINPTSTTVRRLDLDSLPLPFPDSSSEEIELLHVLEHLKTPHLDFLIEMHRILVDGGTIRIAVPSKCDIIQHTKSGFSPKYMKYLETQGLFDIISFKKRFVFRDFLWKLKEFVSNLIFSEYEWILYKKK